MSAASSYPPTEVEATAPSAPVPYADQYAGGAPPATGRVTVNQRNDAYTHTAPRVRAALPTAWPAPEAEAYVPTRRKNHDGPKGAPAASIGTIIDNPELYMVQRPGCAYEWEFDVGFCTEHERALLASVLARFNKEPPQSAFDKSKIRPEVVAQGRSDFFFNEPAEKPQPKPAKPAKPAVYVDTKVYAPKTQPAPAKHNDRTQAPQHHRQDSIPVQLEPSTTFGDATVRTTHARNESQASKISFAPDTKSAPSPVSPTASTAARKLNRADIARAERARAKLYNDEQLTPEESAFMARFAKEEADMAVVNALNYRERPPVPILTRGGIVDLTPRDRSMDLPEPPSTFSDCSDVPKDKSKLLPKMLRGVRSKGNLADAKEATKDLMATVGRGARKAKLSFSSKDKRTLTSPSVTSLHGLPNLTPAPILTPAPHLDIAKMLEANQQLLSSNQQLASTISKLAEKVDELAVNRDQRTRAAQDAAYPWGAQAATSAAAPVRTRHDERTVRGFPDAERADSRADSHGDWHSRTTGSSSTLHSHGQSTRNNPSPDAYTGYTSWEETHNSYEEEAYPLRKKMNKFGSAYSLVDGRTRKRSMAGMVKEKKDGVVEAVAGTFRGITDRVRGAVEGKGEGSGTLRGLVRNRSRGDLGAAYRYEMGPKEPWVGDTIKRK